MLLRSILDALPTPVKVALWLAFSGAVASVASGLSSGQIHLDATSLAVANVLLILARELLDKWTPVLTGAAPASAAK